MHAFILLFFLLKESRKYSAYVKCPGTWLASGIREIRSPDIGLND